MDNTFDINDAMKYADVMDILFNKITEETCPECYCELTEQGYCSSCRQAGQ